ncbi:hypothetical protein PRIEUP_LOCUS485, partial [Pristimantis euphronides]
RVKQSEPKRASQRERNRACQRERNRASQREQAKENETKHAKERETEQAKESETEQAKESETKHAKERETEQAKESETEQAKESETEQAKESETERKRNVGIFSRSAESEYQWLKSRLESKSFQQSVNMVRPCYITNGGFQQFSKDVSWCNFGILYHSKNRGRINITDVKDSLYDDELQYLSQKLKKKNVIVVIDDLTDSSEGQKETIQEAQPRLKELAEEVFLFSTAEKR